MSDIEQKAEAAKSGGQILVIAAFLFLLLTILFQPYSLEIPLRPDKTGWVFTFSNYPWPAHIFNASSFHFAQWHIWAGQIAAGVIGMVFAARAKGKS